MHIFAQPKPCTALKKLLARDQLDSARLLEGEVVDQLSLSDRLCFNRRWADYYIHQDNPLKAVTALEKIMDDNLPAQLTDGEMIRLGKNYHAHLGYINTALLGRIDVGLYHYQKAREYLVDSLKLDDQSIAFLIHLPLGNIYTRLGEYETSLFYLKKAYHKLIDLNKFNSAANVSCDIAINYSSQSKFDEAIDELNRTLLITELTGDTKITLHLSLAEAYTHRGKHGRALQQIGRAKALLQVLSADEKDNDFHELLSDINEQSALAYAGIEKTDSAEQCFIRSLHHRRQQFGHLKTHRVWAKSHLVFGQFLEEQGKLDEALYQYQYALHRVIPEFKTTEENPEISDLFSENTIADIMQSKASTLRKRFDKTKDTESLQLSLACYDRMFATWDILRDQYYNPSSHLTIFSEIKPHVLEAMRTAKLAAIHDARSGYMDKAYEYFQRGKNLLLFETMKKRKSIPDSMKGDWNQLNNELAVIDFELFEIRSTYRDEDKGEMDSLSDLRYRLINRKKEFQSSNDDKPTNQNQNQNQLWLSITDTEQLLPKNGVFIDYFVLDTTIVRVTISKSIFQWVELPSAGLLQAQADTLLSAMLAYHFGSSAQQTDAFYRNQAELFHRLSHKLYQDLIPGEVMMNNHMIISPDGIFNYLPFDILLKTNTQMSTAFKHHDYLIRHHNISYCLSAGLWKSMHNRKSSGKGFLGMAPQYANDRNLLAHEISNKRSLLGPLNWNDEEVNQINQLLQGAAYTNEGDLLNIFLREAPTREILHLASHAKLDSRFGDYSFVAFGDDELDRLYLRNIQDLDLSAEMVVLSACETGVGEYLNGEGVNSLGRGFVQAGASSVIMSLWQVNDKSTSEIMASFYQHLKKGQSKSGALRLAKLDYIDQQIEQHVAHPFYWAAFIPNGDMSPIFHPIDSRPYVVFALLLLAGLFFWYWQRNKPSRLRKLKSGNE